MPRPSLAPAWTALPLLAALSGCAPPAPPPPALALAQTLLTCRAEPPVPDLTEDADLMRYVLDLIEAGEDCRARLARVREVLGREGRE